MADDCILLTGATGYVGGRLLRVLERDGLAVRCLVRGAGRLAGRVNPRTELVEGDALDAASLSRAMAGVTTAYYLIRSPGSHAASGRDDRAAATNFAQAARTAGVRRIIYLSELGGDQAVGDVLRGSGAGLEVVELRSSLILGSGSLLFEMIRGLVERGPFMLAPRWARTRFEPIAIDDLLDCLRAALELPASGHRRLEIGGPESVSCEQMMLAYARQCGRRIRVMPVPGTWPRLSSLWLALMTPLHPSAGCRLIDAISRQGVVCQDSARGVFNGQPKGYAQALADAAASRRVETCWSDALSSSGLEGPLEQVPVGSDDAGQLEMCQVVDVPAPPSEAFRPIHRIGGSAGWYYADWLWQLRGVLDLLCGGVGMGRGRRDPDRLNIGDALDCWRVTSFQPDRLLSLSAEMRMWGRGWLQFEAQPAVGGSRIRLRAVFEPSGWLGRAYWHLLRPVHALLFSEMLRKIAQGTKASSGAQVAAAAALG